jgi:uncharacterized protein
MGKKNPKSLQLFGPVSKHSQTLHTQVPALEVRGTKHKGRGVFARAFIQAGTRILNIEGVRLKPKDIPPDSMAMQIEEDMWLCSDGTLIDDYINHSCDPNAGFARNDLVLYALRDIHQGEELSWDYSTSISECGWRLLCRCGAVNCRRVILPFNYLTFEERARLVPISLQYLQKRFPSQPNDAET